MLLIGRITKDAVIKTLKDERQVVNFTIAINDYYKPKGAEGITLTTYYSCSYWLSTKIAARLTKGSLIEITGRIYINTHAAFDGEAEASLNCHVNSVTVHQHVKNNKSKSEVVKKHIADDLPF